MIARIGSVFLMGLALVLASSPVRAEWHEASSEHFVIYANESEDEVRLYAENLERYHSAMEEFTGRDLATPSPSNRVKVFAVGSSSDIRKLAGSSGVEGFY
ncbi:MAG: hypothetical protein AAGK01_06795, partial [Pseudomonadota bacterium]